MKVPCTIQKNKRQCHVNLLLLEKNNIYHYVLIRDLSRLVSSKIKDRNIRLHFCDGCLQHFNESFKLEAHLKYGCNKVCIQMPNTSNLKSIYTGEQVAENILKFTNYERSMKVPFIIVADFEPLQLPIKTCMPNETNSPFITKTHEHIPYSFAYYIICNFDKQFNKYVTYTGENCTSVFIQQLTADAQLIYERYYKIKKTHSIANGV